MDYHSMKNQDILGKLVNREVVHLFSYQMEELFTAELINREAFESWEYLDYDGQYAKFQGGDRDDLEEEIDRLEALLASGEIPEGFDRMALEAEIHDLQDLEPDYAMPDEYWVVTKWFAKKLSDAGQMVYDWIGMWIWGRFTTGQAILLDYVIGRIGEDMKILEGQEHEWKA